MLLSVLGLHLLKVVRSPGLYVRWRLWNTQLKVASVASVVGYVQ